MYILNEIVTIFFIFRGCHGSSFKALNAADLCAQRYSNRQHLSHQYFPVVENRFRQEAIRDAKQMFFMNKKTEINDLAMVELNQTGSLDEISEELHIRYEKSVRISAASKPLSQPEFYQLFSII